MKIFFKITAIIITILLLTSIIAYLTEKNEYNQWKIQSDSTIAWASFIWVGDSIGGKYFERTAMHIPCRIEGLPYNFTFQFDLGADLTRIYENNANSVLRNHPEFSKRISRFKSVFQFWNKHKSFKDLTVMMGDIKIHTSDCFVMENYGDEFSVDPDGHLSPIPMGTIGPDIFVGKVLIIDYPNQRFAICNSVPSAYQTRFEDITLDEGNRIIMPMKIHGSQYRITFDNGSSIFPLITLAENIMEFSTGPDIDTIEITSWRQSHKVTGKIVTDTFELAGRKFSNVKVYSNHSGLGIDHNTDAMTGNALFWDNIIIIDYKRKKFGIL
jgi:hypothetical protein